MNFSEALEQIKAGKKVRINKSQVEGYLFMVDKIIACYKKSSEFGANVTKLEYLGHDSIMSDDWEVVE